MATLDQACYRLGLLLYAALTGSCAASMHRTILQLQAPAQPIAAASQAATFDQAMLDPVVFGQCIDVAGMHVAWRFIDDAIEFTATAPTTGWVAVGFNTKDDIVGANLVMGAVQHSILQIADKYVVDFGDPRMVTEIGGIDAIDQPFGYESHAQTTIRFRLPITASDRYHLNLQPGTTLYLIAAYSMDDDFAHHSRMRKHVQITL